MQTLQAEQDESLARNEMLQAENLRLENEMLSRDKDINRKKEEAQRLRRQWDSEKKKVYLHHTYLLLTVLSSSVAGPSGYAAVPLAAACAWAHSIACSASCPHAGAEGGREGPSVGARVRGQ